jgi:phosphotriesterase-related protein
MTVAGPVSADSLGVVLPHEHLISDLSDYYVAPDDPVLREIGNGPVTMERLHILRRNLFAIRDNMVLDDVDLAVAEAQLFRDLGGATIVDTTPPDGHRDPGALAEISRRTGLHVVMGCGHYVHTMHPTSLAAETQASVTRRLLDEIQNGIGDSGLRPGIIGELGTWDPLHPDEEKVLRAAAEAQAATGLAITVHVHVTARAGNDVLDVLEDAGADLSRVIMGHLDIPFGHLDSDEASVLDYHRSLADRGCVIEFDTVGTENYEPASPVTPAFWTALDLTRARAVRTLVDEGYGDRLLLSHDVFTKFQLVAFGGMGYGHILRDFQHRLREVGVAAADIERILVHNPRRALAG